ncbi:FhaA domain-containing protein [[Kitasatospora] papulosa]|uniref:DUF3662 domain-containing protein n=1 Tax=[Kitasatospora] papulosa TaxID=1464011 RepID=UPI00364519D7
MKDVQATGRPHPATGPTRLCRANPSHDACSGPTRSWAGTRDGSREVPARTGSQPLLITTATARSRTDPTPPTGPGIGRSGLLRRRSSESPRHSAATSQIWLKRIQSVNAHSLEWRAIHTGRLTVGTLNKLERRFEAWVNGAFAKAFKSAVQPLEFVGALRRECDVNARIWSQDRTVAPNGFVIELNTDDHALHSACLVVLGEELVEQVRAYAESQHYSFMGPLKVQLQCADDLATGRYRVRSRIEIPPDVQRAMDAAEHRALSVREWGGHGQAMTWRQPPRSAIRQKQVLTVEQFIEHELSIDNNGMLFRRRFRPGAEPSHLRVVKDLGTKGADTPELLSSRHLSPARPQGLRRPESPVSGAVRPRDTGADTQQCLPVGRPQLSAPDIGSRPREEASRQPEPHGRSAVEPSRHRRAGTIPMSSSGSSKGLNSMTNDRDISAGSHAPEREEGCADDLGGHMPPERYAAGEPQTSASRESRPLVRSTDALTPGEFATQPSADGVGAAHPGAGHLSRPYTGATQPSRFSAGPLRRMPLPRPGSPGTAALWVTAPRSSSRPTGSCATRPVSVAA